MWCYVVMIDLAPSKTCLKLGHCYSQWQTKILILPRNSKNYKMPKHMLKAHTVFFMSFLTTSRKRGEGEAFKMLKLYYFSLVYYHEVALRPYFSRCSEVLLKIIMNSITIKNLTSLFPLVVPQLIFQKIHQYCTLTAVSPLSEPFMFPKQVVFLVSSLCRK